MTELDLQVPTAPLPHRIEDLLSTDYIELPPSTEIAAARRDSALVGDGRMLSDHDAYVVTI